jgi:hypothetical protein
MTTKNDVAQDGLGLGAVGLGAEQWRAYERIQFQELSSLLATPLVCIAI